MPATAMHTKIENKEDKMAMTEGVTTYQTGEEAVERDLNLREKPFEESQDEEENSSIEHRIEEPSANPVTSSSEEMEKKHSNMAHHIGSQEQHLAIESEGEACAGQADLPPETVGIDEGVKESGNENSHDLKGLGKFEPEEGHEKENGMVEKPEEGEVAVAKNGEEGAEEVEEAREVEDVGPEEDRARGTSSKWEAEEPFEGSGSGSGSTPEPAGMADFGVSGEEDAKEDEEREDGHEKAVDGRDGAQGDATTPTPHTEEQVEQEGGDHVGGDGVDQEVPGGAP
ncbi:hypothetical protein G2W53_031520 [Senna tora]|uniref:Uncharacterized protein n=1 Tax=Senna tora TaxID=362788 RepID=A0A834WFM2_9FABA|nr:hypothetical protein G2W53_031520 [Senna tora]